jgi:hypothetical protein
MYMHRVHVARRPKQDPRPAKVVQLETRRQARLERMRQERERPRPAA